jgi:hypothetical protein
MTTHDYALIISLFSIAISIGALLWNVWQKFIFVKPTLQVSFGLYHVMQHKSADVLTRSVVGVLAEVVFFTCVPLL